LPRCTALIASGLRLKRVSETQAASAGLALIQARLLAVNFADDELNPVELGELERAVTRVN
jgi:hypothetical protein